MTITTSTLLNIIHFSCHREEFKGDKQLKQLKKEWEVQDFVIIIVV